MREVICNMNDNKTKSAKNLICSAFGQIITIAIGLVLPRLYIVNYGSAINGVLNSVNQFVVYLGLFESGIGVVSLQALYGPVARNDLNSINSILSATNLHYKRAGYGYLASLIGLSLIYPLLVNVELDYLTVVGLVFFSGISNVILFLFQGKYRLLLQAEGKNYIITNLSTIVSVLIGISKVILVATGYNALCVLVVSAAINLIQAIYICLYINRKYKWVDLKVTPNMSAISEKNFMLVHQISGMIFHNTDILILTLMGDLKVVSVYSIYKLIITQLENILTIFVGSFNFALGQSFNTNIEDYKLKIDVFESYYSAIAFSLFTVAQCLLVPFMGLYTAGVDDIKYQDNMLAFLFVFIAMLTVMRTSMLYTINFAGHFKKTTIPSILESFINIVISLALVFSLGIFVILFGTVAALLYRVNDVILYANKRILKRSPLGTYLIYIVNFAVYAGLSALFSTMLSEINSYGEFVFYGGLFAVISLLVFILAQSIVFPNRMKKVFNFIVKKRKEK